ncbi:MAG: DNA cytosine methyltransferase [Candidatus Thiodiazotropha sp.]
MYTFYEFFAGGGMARAGLGSEWSCLFANDFDEKKSVSYCENWGKDHFRPGDVSTVTTSELPDSVDLAWASFPCQDLSLAGAGAGLKGERSGTFWPFWDLMRGLNKEGRAPRLIVLENVYGALRSHGGKDFAAIANALAKENYKFGAVVINAVHFVPQSRPRLFIVGVHNDLSIPSEITMQKPDKNWHPDAIKQALNGVTKKNVNKWVWWNLGGLPERSIEFADLIEENPKDVKWHSRDLTKRLISLMSETNLKKVQAAKKAGCRMVGGVYKRTRSGEQRAEVRFDVSGCLRTPAGGSSRQTIIVVDGNKVRTRLLSPREAARLMGLQDSYKLPSKYNDAYHLAGDGLVVPVVRYLAEKIIEPILKSNTKSGKKAA